MKRQKFPTNDGSAVLIDSDDSGYFYTCPDSPTCDRVYTDHLTLGEAAEGHANQVHGGFADAMSAVELG